LKKNPFFTLLKYNLKVDSDIHNEKIINFEIISVT